VHQQCCLGAWIKQVLWRRYQLPIVVIIMNNSGIYGGDRRQQQLREAAHRGAKAAGFGDDPEPTSFVPDAKYAIAAKSFLSCTLD